jgi:hypothetical protein
MTAEPPTLAELKIILNTVYPDIRNLDQRPLPGIDSSEEGWEYKMSGVDCDAVFRDSIIIGNLYVLLQVSSFF